MAGAFAKMAAAKPTGGGNNIRDGIYTLIVEKFFLNEGGHSGDCIIAEFRVKEAAPNGAVDEKGVPVVPNSAGSACSMVCNLTKHAAAAGNAKAFAQAAVQSVLGLSWSEFVALEIDGQKTFPGGEEQANAWLCGPDNPLCGAEVRDETYRGTNRGRDNPANAGKPLTLNKWFPVSMTPELIEANKKLVTTTSAKADTGVAAAPAAAPATSAASSSPATAPAPVTPPSPPTSPALAGILNRARGGK